MISIWEYSSLQLPSVRMESHPWVLFSDQHLQWQLVNACFKASSGMCTFSMTYTDLHCLVGSITLICCILHSIQQSLYKPTGAVRRNIHCLTKITAFLRANMNPHKYSCKTFLCMLSLQQIFKYKSCVLSQNWKYSKRSIHSVQRVTIVLAKCKPGQNSMHAWVMTGL